MDDDLDPQTADDSNTGSFLSDLTNNIKNIGSAAGNVLGAINAPKTAAANAQAATSTTTLYIIGGVVVVVLLGLFAFMRRGR